MCPACISAVTLTVVGTTSTGGLVALLARMLRVTRGAKTSPRPSDHGSAGIDWVRPKNMSGKGRMVEANGRVPRARLRLLHTSAARPCGEE